MTGKEIKKVLKKILEGKDISLNEYRQLDRMADTVDTVNDLQYAYDTLWKTYIDTRNELNNLRKSLGSLYD